MAAVRGRIAYLRVFLEVFYRTAAYEGVFCSGGLGYYQRRAFSISLIYLLARCTINSQFYTSLVLKTIGAAYFSECYTAAVLRVYLLTENNLPPPRGSQHQLPYNI